MTILFAGGGTMGPVTPLLAVLRAMRKRRPDLTFAWAGTPDGPERDVVAKDGVAFYPIPVAKLPRFLSAGWVTWPFRYINARRAAERVIKTVKPDLVASAGGFTSVPVMLAAHVKGIPCAIHQLDAEPGLSNKSVASFCDSVTTSFRYDLPPFRGVTSERVATPCRFSGVSVPDRKAAAASFGLNPTRPVVFIVGGGTGASSMNEAIWSVLDDLLKKTQIIHMTGKGKGNDVARIGYVQKEFLDEKEMLNAYAAADLVISRAGIGGISDLASLSKPAVFVPIPGSHQERNVDSLMVEVVKQGLDFPKRLLDKIIDILGDEEYRLKCGERLHDEFPTDDGTALAERWLMLVP